MNENVIHDGGADTAKLEVTICDRKPEGSLYPQFSKITICDLRKYDFPIENA